MEYYRYFFITIICLTILHLSNLIIITPTTPVSSITQPPTTKDVKVLLMILSGRHNIEKRILMRKFERMMFDGMEIKFFIGNRPCRVPTSLRSTPYTCIGNRPTDDFDNELKKKEIILQKEMDEFGDIIEVDMVDYYRALPKKLKLSYKWGIENTNAEWFYKTDDDCFFNAPLIFDHFSSLTYDHPVVIGNVRKGIKVPKSGKWAELNYKKDKYPSFPLGSFSHVSNRLFVDYVAQHTDELYEYQGEDVSVGIWADENIPNVELIRNTDNMSSKNTCSKKSWTCGHEIYTTQFIKFSKYISF